MRRKRKAQSEIVTTILIILLVLAAIVIVWNVVKKTVTEGSENLGAGTLFNVQMKVEDAEFLGSQVKFSISRGADNIKDIKVMKIKVGSSVKEYAGAQIPNPLETKEFFVTNVGANDKDVEIYVAGSDNKLLLVGSYTIKAADTLPPPTPPDGWDPYTPGLCYGYNSIDSCDDATSLDQNNIICSWLNIHGTGADCEWEQVYQEETCEGPEFQAIDFIDSSAECMQVTGDVTGFCKPNTGTGPTSCASYENCVFDGNTLAPSWECQALCEGPGGEFCMWNTTTNQCVPNGNPNPFSGISCAYLNYTNSWGSSCPQECTHVPCEGTIVCEQIFATTGECSGYGTCELQGVSSVDWSCVGGEVTIDCENGFEEDKDACVAAGCLWSENPGSDYW